MNPPPKTTGVIRDNNKSMLRKKLAIENKRHQVNGLSALLIEWERVYAKEWSEENHDYIVHLKARLRAAKTQLESMCGI